VFRDVIAVVKIVQNDLSRIRIFFMLEGEDSSVGIVTWLDFGDQGV
jgi:hypothetical protein